jgi:hypothetical protein
MLFHQTQSERQYRLEQFTGNRLTKLKFRSSNRDPDSAACVDPAVWESVGRRDAAVERPGMGS